MYRARTASTFPTLYRPHIIWRADKRPSLSMLSGYPACLRRGTALLFSPSVASYRLARTATDSTATRSKRQQFCVRAARFENRELLIGDCTSLLSFCLYKQVSALVQQPTFPGWLAPLHFSPLRFVEFASFALTVCGTWVAASALVGGYKRTCTADLPTTVARASQAWLVAMPVAAAQLVLSTASEDRVLVGTGGFAANLPMAATGAGEPFITAAGVLGLMTVWRAFYTSYLDFYNMRTLHGSPIDRARDVTVFAEALSAAIFLSLACTICIQAASSIGEANLEGFVQALMDGSLNLLE